MPTINDMANPVNFEHVQTVDAPTIGVIGQRWRASVSAWGAIDAWEQGGSLDWYIAADDRWHVPAAESTVRQVMVDGTPVIETRLRIPQGDAVHRAYCTADHGGLTVIQVDNESPLPIAVAFTGMPVMSARPAADMTIEGIDLPADAVAFPVGHHASVTVAIAHDRPRAAVLPGSIASSAQVVRGWLQAAERASRLMLPDAAMSQAVVRERCQLLLDGPPTAANAPVEFLLAVAQLVRMGSIADPWVPEIVEAVAALANNRRDTELAAALDAAERVCCSAGETRAVRDLATVRTRLVESRDTERQRPYPSGHGVRFVSAVEGYLATGADLFPGGVPAEWLGQNFEAHGVPVAPDASVSFALRWHGGRPAILWELTGAKVTLSSQQMAPGWSTDQRTGETLWPVPPNAPPNAAHNGSTLTAVVGGDDVSFS